MVLKTIIFDFDGVIANTLDINYQICKMVVPDLDFNEYVNWHNGNIFDNPTLRKVDSKYGENYLIK